MMTTAPAAPRRRSATTFSFVAEIDAPREPDLGGVARQMDALAPLDPIFLVPDNHAGRPTVSSLVVAAEVQRRGGRAIACCNARDRNLLGLRRDLLTARALGIDELLLVHGDDVQGNRVHGDDVQGNRVHGDDVQGGRVHGDDVQGAARAGLTVRTMLEECGAAGVRAGVTAGLGPLPGWKRAADRLFVQVSWSLDDVLRWRDGLRFDGAVFVGVMVPANREVAIRIGEQIPQLRLPPSLLDALARDRDAGVRAAADLVRSLRASEAFAGVHLIAGRRARAFVDRLRALDGACTPVPNTTEETCR